MCGITGWVDYARDLTHERATVEAMNNTLGNRGPDARGVWVAPHAGLGHTRNSIIDLAGGVQPMTAEENGRTLAVLTYSGEVYNFKQLRSELESRGHRFRTRSDTEVVLRSYLEWGENCAEHLEGMFGFAVWDLRTEQLVLVRDRLGIKPVFYSVRPDGILFGSEPKALLAHPDIRPVVGVPELQELFSTAKTPGQAVFRDMQELLPGHTLTVSRSGLRTRRYWTLEARPHTDDLDTTVGHIRSLLEEIVTRELVADVPLCTTLSGGIDSSVVTALAARARAAAGDEPVRTITANFVGYSENFRPDDQRDTPDAPYAAELARHVGSDHTDIVLGTADLIGSTAREAAVVAQDMPTMLGDMDTSLYLMLRATREHSTVALTGETADEIFGGFKWLHDSELVAADNFPWIEAEKRQEGSRNGQGRGLFERGLLDKLDMPAYYADAFQQTRSLTPHQAGEDAREFRMRELCYAHLTRWLPMLLDRGDRLAMASSLETRVPFCDHRLVEYVYNTPWSFKTFDGREKSLLRAAGKDLLPVSVLERPKSPYPVTQDPAYTRALHDAMAEVLADPGAPVLPLLDVAAARKAVADDSPTAHEWHSRSNLEMALGVDFWLRHYGITLEV
ncbi:asparagine synthase (glutamine-hydrolyzing) [Streptomyces morookaense]|uniref:asparagine synthase (glutamine-hydrolyzing) n=1 Tax=Streptomyces morookaense TaxID=1970 RepID=A0A7Y7E6L6_STRMO|nr:asparagine synthase (glutamine-hydrolyzing) [Streptomyces morookaense]NVK77521.1 asparagine synthase (glutamine-hydrolyzing) [Streptomyces morookaense]GHF22252.1 asparagine synthetase B [Streptomyces morookaense]